MKDNPLVSIIIPTYNRANTIHRAINSILNQSYPNIEILIVDDHSIDNTEDLILEYQKKNSNIKYYRNNKNMGCGPSRNQGILMAKGDFIAFLDDDDEFYPEKILCQINIFRNNSFCDVVVSNVQKKIPEKKEWIDVEFSPYCLFDGCQLICKKTVFKDIQFRCNYMEWRDIAFQIYMKGYNVFFSNDNLVKKNSTKKSLSKNYKAMFESALINAMKYYTLTQTSSQNNVFKNYLSNCYKTCGNYELKKGKILSASRHYYNSFLIGKRIQDLIPFW